MPRLISTLRLGPGSWMRFVYAYIWLFRARRLMKRARGQQWLFSDRVGSGGDALLQPTEKDWALIKLRVAAVSRASRYPRPWAFCLQQSLALREWLAADGIAAEVRYGLRQWEDEFFAHAWVECDGKVINDSAAYISNFAPLTAPADYDQASRARIEQALVTSKTGPRGAGEHV